MARKPTYEEPRQRVKGLDKCETEHKQTGEMLPKEESLYRTLFEAANDAIFILEDYRFVACNKMTLKMFGCEKDKDILGCYPWDFSPPKQPNGSVSKEKAIAMMDASIGGKPQSFYWKHARKNGKEFDAEISLNRLEIGGTYFLQAIVRDITERMQTEEVLKDEAIRWRILVEQSRDGIVVLDQNGKVYEANQRYADMLGYTMEEIHQLHVWDWDAQWTQEQLLEMIQTVDDNGDHFETRHRRKDGTFCDVEISTNGAVYRGQKLIFCVCRDISDRKRAEDELKMERDRAQMYLDLAGVMFVALDKEGNVTLLNKKGCEILGYEEQEIIGEPWFDRCLPEHMRDEVKTIFFQLMKGVVGPVEYYENPVLTKNGDERYIAWHNALLRNEKGDLVGTFSSGEDVTERRAAETEREKLLDQLRQAYKMEAIGTLAGGIAHDFNNILSPIIIHTELALLDLASENPIRHNLEEVLTASKRAKDLVDQILTFSRQDEQELKPLKIGPIVKEALKLLRASLPSTIKIQQDFEKELSTVFADPVQIHQVLMNLCTNAAHAMREKGGVLAISLVNVDVNLADTASVANLNPGPYLRLTVSDTGHGTDRSTMSRMFDPYFTTKGKGEGTGMGLAVVHGVIANHGGAIFVDSEPEKGTRFDIYLPRTKYQIIQDAKKQVRPPQGTERILLVDDDQAMVRAVRQMLERLGYHVTSKTNSIEALDIFQADPERFDIVITDQTMPNITGAQLAQKMMRVRSDIPIILCTGFSELIDEEMAKKIGIQELVMKPIVMNDIGFTIRKVLGESD